MTIIVTFLLLAMVNGASLNQSVSELGIALVYNSDLADWNEEDNSGTPTINGYLTVESPPGRHIMDGKNFTYPKWTEDMQLRICM